MATSPLIAAVIRRHAELFAALRHLPPFPVDLMPDGYPHAELFRMLEEDMVSELPAAHAAMGRLLRENLTDRR